MYVILIFIGRPSVSRLAFLGKVHRRRAGAGGRGKEAEPFWTMLPMTPSSGEEDWISPVLALWFTAELAPAWLQQPRPCSGSIQPATGNRYATNLVFIRRQACRRMASRWLSCLRREGDVWVYNPQRNGMTRLTFGGPLVDSPIWSPDGQYVVFARYGDGRVFLDTASAFDDT